MKLEHLIQAYNFNNIQAIVKDKIEDKEEIAGVIKFNNSIHASYLLDKENVVTAISIFCNCIADKYTIDIQLKHTIDIINIMQKTIEILENITQEEANKILEILNIFSGKIENKVCKALKYTYSIEIIGELLKMSVTSSKSKAS